MPTITNWPFREQVSSRMSDMPYPNDDKEDWTECIPSFYLFASVEYELNTNWTKTGWKAAELTFKTRIYAFCCYQPPSSVHLQFKHRGVHHIQWLFIIIAFEFRYDENQWDTGVGVGSETKELDCKRVCLKVIINKCRHRLLLWKNILCWILH